MATLRTSSVRTLWTLSAGLSGEQSSVTYFPGASRPLSARRTLPDAATEELSACADCRAEETGRLNGQGSDDRVVMMERGSVDRVVMME